jgi:general secretion pathway protein D
MNRHTIVKSILFVLLLTSVSLRAQGPPGGAPGGAPAAPAASSTPSAPASSSVGQGPTRSATPRYPWRNGANGGPAGPGGAPGAPGAPDANVNPAEQPGGTPPPPANNVHEETVPAGEINFQQADLNQVLDIYAKLVHRTVLRPANLAAQNIVLKTQTPLSQSEAVQALDAVLGMNGIGMINVGDKFVKAVQLAQVNQEAGAFNKLTAAQMPEMGPYVTHIVQLHYAKPTEMVPVLQPFAKIANSILAIDSSGILVLRDFAENVKRMLEMIEKIDVAIPMDYISEVIPIKYALASDIASALNSLSGSGGGAVSTGTRSTATRQGMTGGGFGRTGMGATGGYGSTTGMGGYPGAAGSGMNSGMGATSAAGSTTGGNSFTSRLQGIINRAASSGEFQILGQTKIIADERTNSLLIFASKEDMKMIKDIVGKLDIVLAQVLIETVILEVNVDDSKSLGVSYQELQSHGIGNYFQGIGAINNNNALTASSYASGLTSSTNSSSSSSSGVPSGFSYLGALGNDLNVTVTAIAAHTHGKILQCPRIQTSNAKQASLFVGETVPYPSGSYYGGGAYGGYSSIQQMQIGVSIDVTPLINPDGLVVMDIHQKIDDVQSFVDIANVGNVPVTSSKEAMASVAVRDHDTIILGGLISNNKTANNSGVPFLKDIPLLGALFRSTSKDDTRDELIVLIRPTVLPTPEVAALTATAERNAMPEIKRAEHEFRYEDTLRLQEANRQIRADEKKLNDARRLEQKKKGPVYENLQDQQTTGNTNGQVRILLDDKTQPWQSFDPKNPPPPIGSPANP